MTTPRRYQHPRVTRQPVPPGAVYVTRPGPWGNPFRQETDESVDACVARFEAHYQDDTAYQAAVTLHLRGKPLVCWCKLEAPCHADVLLKWANTEREENP